MILFMPAIIAGVAVGLLMGGNLSRLARFPLRFTWLIVVAILIQLVIFSSWIKLPNLPSYLVPGLHVFSLLMLILAFSLNHTFLGVKIIGLGLLLNFLPIVANGGYMPGSPEALQQIGKEQLIVQLQEQGHVSKSILMTPDTRLNFLGDRLIINLPAIGARIFSIGDAVISVGGFVLVSQAMLWRRKRWEYG